MTSLRALAHARLERALPETVAAVGHPAVSCEHRLTDRRPTYRLCFLCSVFMTWSFGDRRVDIYCRADASSGALPHHLRFRFAPRRRVADHVAQPAHLYGCLYL